MHSLWKAGARYYSTDQLLFILTGKRGWLNAILVKQKISGPKYHPPVKKCWYSSSFLLLRQCFCRKTWTLCNSIYILGLINGRQPWFDTKACSFTYFYCFYYNFCHRNVEGTITNMKVSHKSVLTSCHLCMCIWYTMINAHNLFKGGNVCGFV